MVSAGTREEPGFRPLRWLGHGLWMLIPVLSLGMLAMVPAAQAWWKVRSAGWAIVAGLLTVSGITVMLGMTLDLDSTTMGLNLIGGTIAGVAAAVSARRVVFEQQDPKPDPAVAHVLEQRQRREHARAIVDEDPAMAVALGIGRPELPGQYEDGGLVDLNHTTAAVLTVELGWPEDAATRFVHNRDARGGYESMREIVAMSGLDPRIVDQNAERIVLLPYRI